MTNEGKTVNNDAYSGFGKSGAVQMRKYTSSASSDGTSERRGASGSSSSPSGSCGVIERASSAFSTAQGSGGTVTLEEREDADGSECERGGISKNGSLGARARLL